MRKNLTKKLFLSILTLAFAVVSLGASTYAWFILSEDASVKSFSGTVTAGTSGLEIQVAAIGADPVDTKWRSTELDIANDLPTAADVTFDALQNAATFSGSAFTKLDTSVAGEENGNYVAFRLYFRLADVSGIPTEGEKVYLTDYDLTTEGTPGSWYVNKAYEGVTGPVAVGEAGVVYYVSDAARIAFVAGGTSTVYEAETLAGAANFASHGIGEKGAFSYYNAVSDADLTLPSYYTAKTSLDAAQELGTLTAGANQAYVDVYVWIDGWDQECINAIFTQQLNIALKFSLNNTLQED